VKKVRGGGRDMCSAPINSSSSPVEVEGAPGQTAAHHCELGKGNILLNKHEGKKDVKLGCDTLQDF